MAKNGKAKEKKEKKDTIPTIVSVIKRIMEVGVKSKEDCVEQVLEIYKNKGITHNIRGNEITKESVMRHLGNIEKALGTRKGWWSQYNLVEKENFRQWVPVEAEA